MDFLRLHLPGLHQALRGALDSFITFVSYLLGDEVPTAGRREARAAEELGEVAAGRLGRTVEEEAQEALEGLGGSQSTENRGLRGPGEAERRQEGSSATEQTWGWGEGSSHGSQADRQDTGDWKAAKATRGQDFSVPLEARKKPEAGSEAGRDRSSQSQKSQEPDEQEVNREETLRTWEWEEEEEEEEFRATEPGVAGGAESEWTWRKEPKGKAGADGPDVAGDGEASEQVVKEAAVEEVQGPGAGGAGREEEVAVVSGGQGTRVQGTQEPGAESEDGEASGREEAGTTLGREEARTTLGREEAGATSGGEEAETTSGREEAGASSDKEEAGTISGREEAGASSDKEEAGTISGREEAGASSDKEEAGTISGREEADLPTVNETEPEAVPGERTSEGTGRVWTLEDTSKGDQGWEVDEPREAEVSLLPRQTRALGTEGVEEAAKDQGAGREAEEGQGSEGELGEGLAIQADQAEEEAVGRQDAETGASQASPEEVVQPEEAREPEERSWAAEAELLQDKMAKEAEGEAVLGATPEARPEKELSRESGGEEEEAQTGGGALEAEWGGLEHEVTEDQDPELVRGPLAPREQAEGGQAGPGELWSIPAPGREETERVLEEYPRNAGDIEPNHPVLEASGHWRRRDKEGGNSQEEKEDAEGAKEEAGGGQALAAEAGRGQESLPADIPGAGGECLKAEEAWRGAENWGLGGGHGPAAGTSPSPGESDAGDTKEGWEEAAVPWGADGTFRSGWRIRDSDDTEADSVASQHVEDKAALDGRAAGAGEAGGRGWDSEGRAESGRGEGPVGAAEGEKRGWQELGLEGSAEEGAPGGGGRVEAYEGKPDGERVEAGELAVAEGSCGLVDVTSAFQVLRAGGLPGGQIPCEEEAAGWQTKEQGPGREGQPGDQPPGGEAQSPLDVEEVQDQKTKAEENDPEGPEDVQVQEDQWANQHLAEAEPGPCREAAGDAHSSWSEAGVRAGDAHSSWSEAPLPGSRLDVSIPRSRVFLSRSSSQRRSRPSFRRSLAPEQREEPPSPPSEEELPASEQRLLQPENTPEPSPPRPEGTPLPARRRPLGQGFGLGHPGMMQELRARLGQPKPQ
uniref:Apolipoprotein B receptor n=1 Tax=Catagonus wagneri TaxID=51154 RepID=A0A8C3X3K9_9CETA